MLHEDILYMYFHKYIKTYFVISNMHCQTLHLNNFKGDFYKKRLHPQTPDVQIVLSQPNSVLF